MVRNVVAWCASWCSDRCCAGLLVLVEAVAASLAFPGSQGVRGSNPLSSTKPCLCEPTPTRSSSRFLVLPPAVTPATARGLESTVNGGIVPEVAVQGDRSLGSTGHSDTRLDLGRAPVRWSADRAGVHLPLSWPDGAPARDPGQAGFWVSRSPLETAMAFRSRRFNRLYFRQAQRIRCRLMRRRRGYNMDL